MKNPVVFGLAIIVGVAFGSPVFSQNPGFPGGPACGTCDCPCPEVKAALTPLVEKREPTCECETKKLWRPEIKEVRGCKWVDTDVCREIEEDVVATKMVPYSFKDPATGTTRTEYYPQRCVERVKHLVIQVVPVKKEYGYRVVSFKPEEIEVQKTKPVFECGPPVPVITKIPMTGAGICNPAYLSIPNKW